MCFFLNISSMFRVTETLMLLKLDRNTKNVFYSLHRITLKSTEASKAASFGHFKIKIENKFYFEQNL